MMLSFPILLVLQDKSSKYAPEFTRIVLLCLCLETVLYYIWISSYLHRILTDSFRLSACFPVLNECLSECCRSSVACWEPIHVHADIHLTVISLHLVCVLFHSWVSLLPLFTCLFCPFVKRSHYFSPPGKRGRRPRWEITPAQLYSGHAQSCLQDKQRCACKDQKHFTPVSLSLMATTQMCFDVAFC